MERKRMRARITAEDLRLSEHVEPKEVTETWKKIIDATWDMTIVAVAYNDMRVPLSRVPETLSVLDKQVANVAEESTLDIIEEEIKTGIRHFSDIVEKAQASKSEMEKILRATWNRRVKIKT